MFNQGIEVNIVPGGAPAIVHAAKGDNGRDVTCRLLEGDHAAAVDNTMSASVEGVKPSGATFTASATIHPSNMEPYISFAVTSAMTAEAGKAACRIKITKGNDIVSTGKFILDVEDLN